MLKIILATRNPGKANEISGILEGLPLELTSLLESPHLPDVREDGQTLEENALKKAREIFTATGLPALSDDTGLEVYHLGMRPGVLSARYAGDAASYEDNYRRLLAELSGVPDQLRGARFRCVAVFVAEGLTRMTEGTCKGRITTEPRGTGGFGYDPVFLPDGFSETFGQLSTEVKNMMSHRAEAFRQMKVLLAEYLEGRENRKF
jgi:XTP/dITP diphosphohydrolase